MYRRKLFCLRVFGSGLILGAFVLFTVIVFEDETDLKLFDQKIEVNSSSVEKVGLLDDISNATVQPNDHRSIFFLLTQASKNDVISLSTVACCAIESAAFFNPNRSIFVLFMSPVEFPSNKTQSPTLAALRSYTNIHFLHIDIGTFVKGTIAEDFYRSGQLLSSIFPIEHTSDFLRVMVLHKYGGIYLDTDVIVQKSFDLLPANFMGLEAFGGGIFIQGINGAVIGFQDQIGHEVLELCLNEFVENFEPNGWANNGPQLLTRVILNGVCKSSPEKIISENCRGINIYPPIEFYPVNYDAWQELLDAERTKVILGTIENSTAVHLWNHFWRGEQIKKSESKTAYEAIAEKNCARVFTAAGDYL